MKILSFAAVFLMVSMALVADYFLKIAGTKPTMFNLYFLGGTLIYLCTAFVWYFVLKNIEFTEANLFYSLFTILLSVVIGTLIFREPLELLEVVGIAMAIGSIILLTRFA